MSPRVRVVDTADSARDLYRTFVDRKAPGERKMPFDWPPTMVEVGKCLAVMYTSDKWKATREYEDYKHIAEAPQQLITVPGWIRRGDSQQRVRTYDDPVELVEPMPKHFAALAPLLGIQAALYVRRTKRGAPALGRGDDGVVEIHVSRGMLGGARHPESNEPFLIVYTPERGGLHAIVTGRELAVERDGIAG